MRYFDYVFYRAYKFASGRTETPAIYGSGVVVLFQLLIVLNVASVLELTLNFPALEKPYFVVIMASLMIIAWIRYANDHRADEIKTRWENELLQKKIFRGWLIVMGIAFLGVTLILISSGIYSKNH